MSKNRNYCLTIWEEPDKEELNEDVRYAIYGEEICPTTGKKHWQSYIELFKPMRFSAIKKIYGKTVHIEKRKGTRDEAKKYCMKDNKWFELGKWIKGQGHRSDLESVADDLATGRKSLSEVALEQPRVYCQFRNGLKDIASMAIKKKTKKFRKLEVTLITGPTGVGKTRSAVESTENYYMIHGSQMQWWQDYDQEKELIIDEYDNDVPITQLLGILDGYQLRLNIKGGHTYANWHKVIITTNLTIEQLHSNAKPAHKKALMRRITNIQNLWDRD